MGSKVKTKNTAATLDKSSPLYRFIDEEARTLLPTIRRIISSADIAKEWNQVNFVAEDILQETVAQALEHSDRFNQERTPKMWLLGIANNLIKQEKDRRIKTRNRQTTILNEDVEEDYNIFDRINNIAAKYDTESAYIQSEQVEFILSLVSSEDAEVLRLAIIAGLDGQKLADQLKIKPATARSKLHRALNRLRTAWYKYEKEGGKSSD